MQLQLLVQTLLTILIPTIGTLLPGILKQDHYPDWLNSLIAGIVVIAAAAGTAYTMGKLGPDFRLDAFVVGALIAAMLAGPFKDLDAYLQSYVSLFNAAQKQIETVSIPTTTPVLYPAAIQPKNDIPAPDTSTHPKAL